MVSFDQMKQRLVINQKWKQAERGRRIDVLVARAIDRGEDDDRIFWSIVHDLEVVPRTTNRRQLEEIGYAAPAPESLEGLDAVARRGVLWELIHALALIHVFLCRTDHLDDGDLLRVLLLQVMEESVPDLPLAVGVRDWVDCSDEPPTADTPAGRGEGEMSAFESDHHRDGRLPRPAR